ncbi:MAG TPA: DUF4440 domain-containing protein [Candidatus Angelobacter sp.]|nr:DUF4440 domain-containing protein [Candidatus Angelobacter sp.]
MDNISQDNEADLAAIDALIAAFFGAFTNKHGLADLGRLRALTIAQCVIVKASAREVYGLEDFISPRAKLLNGGPLAEFEEIETSSSTDIFGNIAQRLSLYRKSGILSGNRFASTGVNQFLLVRMDAGWKIAAVTWDDEREGFVPPLHIAVARHPVVHN